MDFKALMDSLEQYPERPTLEIELLQALAALMTEEPTIELAAGRLVALHQSKTRNPHRNAQVAIRQASYCIKALCDQLWLTIELDRRETKSKGRAS